MERDALIAPSAGAYHYVLATDFGESVVLQHLVTNAMTGAIEDMTALCGLSG